MCYLILGLLAITCAVRWLICWVGMAALIKCLLDRGVNMPSDEELRACNLYVWKSLLHIK